MRCTHMFRTGTAATAMVLSVMTMTTLVLVFIPQGVTSNPQGQFVSQDVDEDSVDYQQQQGRGGDQWWRNYEVVEEHIDDLDDQLEMLYMYSVNPLELSAITTSPKTLSTNRYSPVQSVGSTFDSRQTKPLARGTATFVPSTTTTTLPPRPPPPPQTTLPPPLTPLRTATSLPYSNPFPTVQSVAPIFSDQQVSVQPFDGQQPHSPRNRVRVIVKRPSSGQKVNVPVKNSEIKTPFFDEGVPSQKLPFLNSVAAANKPYDSSPIAAESDPIPRAFPSSDSPLRISQSEQTVLTAATYRNTDTTPHPFLASASTTAGQLPRYSKLLNRYSLLDTVSRDLNSASSEHRDDLALALEDAQREQLSLRQTRNDVQPSSARSFRSDFEEEEESLPSTALPIASSKRPRRRRPKTTPVPETTEWTEQTRSVDWDIGSTNEPADWNDGRVSSRRRTNIPTTTVNDEVLETTLPPAYERGSTLKHVPDSRGIVTGSRRRTPSTSSLATISVSSASIQSVTGRDRHRRPQFTQTESTAPLVTDSRTAATHSSTVSESLRTTTHASTASALDASNDVLGTTARTSSLVSRHLRQRTAPFTGTSKRTTEATTDATTVASKSKETSKFKLRGTAAPRRATSFTTATTTTTTVQPIINSTNEQKPTQRPSFSSSRFRFRPSSSTTVSSESSSSSLSTSTSTVGPVSTSTVSVSAVPTNHSEESGRRKFKPRPSFLHSQHTPKPATTEASTTPIVTTFPATTEETILETTAKISPFAKKFRPRPTGSRFHFSSTTESAQALTPGVSQSISDISNSSSSGTFATTARSFSRNPFKTNGTPPLTRLSTGSTPLFVTTPTILTPSTEKNVELESVSGQEIETTESVTAVSGFIGKRRRRPIGTKKPVPSTSLLITETTSSVSPSTIAASTVGFNRKVVISTTPVAPTDSTSDLMINSSTVPQRRKFRRRKISQRSTLSGAEEHIALNATTMSKSDLSVATASVASTTTSTTTTTTTTTASTVTESSKPTTEASKKTLFGVKAKRNDTDVKSGKEHGSAVPLLSLEGGDIINLQADESGDSVWFSSSGSNVNMPDDVLVQGNGRRGSSRLLSVDDSTDDRRSWFAAAPDDSNLKGADSSSENVEGGKGEGSIDTRPLLISRISSDDLETESHHETADEPHDHIKAEEEAEKEGGGGEEKPSKEASQSRSATFSVSSSTSVHDGETSKSSSSKSEPSVDTTKDDDTANTKAESDGDNSKFIIIDKTALRGSDVHESDDDKQTEKTTEEQDEKKRTSESSDDEEKVKDSDSTTRTTEKATTTTTEKHDESNGEEEERKRDEEEEFPVTTSKSRGRGKDNDEDTSSRATTTTTTKSSERGSSSRSGSSRSRSSSSSRRQQSSTSTVPTTTTTEVTSSTTETPENEKPQSDTAVSYFGEDDEAPSDHGALDHIDGEGAVESSYDPEPPIDDSEGHEGQVSADTVFEHSDPNEDSTHKTESAPVSEDESSIVLGDRWDLSALSEFSGPIRSSSSINVEVLSRAPKLIQLAARREAKSSTSGVGSDEVKTASRQSLRNILKVVGVETMPSTLESSTETPSENSTRDFDVVVSTTKRDVSSVNKFAYPLPSIKTAADIAELFDAITSSPSDDEVVQPFQPPSKAAILKINSTMTTDDNKTTAVTSKSTEDAETLTLQSLTGPANCSKAERNICPKSEDYPREVVDFVVKRHEATLNKLWQEIKADRINARLFAEEPERKKEELSVCDSSIEDLQPGWAKDAATGKWMIILNTPQYPQVLRIESCQRPQRECLFISPYYKSTCVEHYSVHRLVAIRSDDPTSGPVVGIFKFPCGCSCKVEMFHGQNH